MSNGLIGQAKQQAKFTMKNAAASAVQRTRDETLEMVKSATNQVGVEAAGIDPQVSFSGNGKFDTNLESQIIKSDSARLQRLEEELRQLRMQRVQKAQEWAREQEALMQKDKPDQSVVPAVVSPSPKKGPMGLRGRKTKGSGEMLKSKK